MRADNERIPGRVEALLGIGEENAIKGDALMVLGGFPNIRALREQIEIERHLGAVIPTSRAGYFLPERDENGVLTERGAADTMRFYRQQCAKGVGTIRSAESAKTALEQYGKRHQTSIGEVLYGETQNVQP